MMKTVSKNNVRTAASKRFRVLTLTLWLVLAVTSLPGNAADAEPNSEQIDNTRVYLEKWIETQRIISQEKRDLAIATEMLEERIGLLQREIESLHGKIAKAEESIAEADKKRVKMVDENQKLKDASASLTDTMLHLENRTKTLVKRLPHPIKDRVKPLSQRLPQKEAECKLSTAERFQNVVGILNEVDKFNQTITVTSEVRELDKDSSVEVAAMYIGIGQAFYSGSNGTIAGVGCSTEDGWHWTSKNEAAPQITDAISILKNEKVASFVLLPVEIK